MTAPRLLDGLDFVAALVDRRSPKRPLVRPRLRLMSYWSMALLLPIFALPITAVLCDVPLQVPPFSRAANDMVAVALSFDLVWGVLVGLVGLLALVRPVTRARTT